MPTHANAAVANVLRRDCRGLRDNGEKKNNRHRLENLTSCEEEREREKKCPRTKAKGIQVGLGCVLTAPPVCTSGKDLARPPLAWSQEAAACGLPRFADWLSQRKQNVRLFFNIDQELHGPNIRSHSVLKGGRGRGCKLQ